MWESGKHSFGLLDARGRILQANQARKFSLLVRLFFLAIAFFLGGSCRETKGEATNDYQLKAVFLSNFPEFTDWPTNSFAGTNASIVIGILGKDPFGTNLEQMVQGRVVNNHPLAVAHFPGIGEVKNCQILYISNSESRHLPRILSRLKDRSILTVSDIPDFAPRGGMVSLLSGQGDVRLQVNLNAINAAGLTLSSKLLRTAQIVPGTRQ